MQILLTERFDEGLLLLRHMLGWSLIDLTYFSLNKNKEGTRRWDGKLLAGEPHFDDLSQEVCGAYAGSVPRVVEWEWELKNIVTGKASNV